MFAIVVGCGTCRDHEQKLKQWPLVRALLLAEVQNGSNKKYIVSPCSSLLLPGRDISVHSIWMTGGQSAY
jgi:hypothetical protein